MGERQSINRSDTLVAEWERAGVRAEALLCSPVQIQFERMPIACIMFDSHRRVIEWNPAAEQTFGYARDEAVGKDGFLLLLPPAGRMRAQDLIRRLTGGDVTAHSVNENITKDGRTIVCEWHNTPLRNAEGQVVAILSMAQDITARERAEEALRESKRSLASELAGMARLQEVSTRLVRAGDSISLLQEIVDAAIAITAADMGNIQLLDGDMGCLEIVASRGFERPFLDFFREVRGGESACGAAIISRERTVVEDVTSSAIFAGRPALEVLRAAGVRAVQSTPLVSRAGRTLGMLSTHYRMPRHPAERDLHVVDLLARQAADWIERTQVEADRERLLASERQARAEAERLARTKDDFLATLSHELRTPLTAIVGWTDVIKMGIADPELVMHAVEVISRNARAQGQLVADLLDLSRTVAGKMRLQVEPVDLPRVIAAAVEAVTPAADARRIRIRCAIESLPACVQGDATRLQQILWNLLSNAVKFTPEGGRIQVTLARFESQVEVSVSDDGKGIPADFLPHAFQRFRQADASASREYGGLGIGLALVKELTELHGGQVSAASEGEGRGSTFTVRLPLSTAAPQHGDTRQLPRALAPAVGEPGS